MDDMKTFTIPDDDLCGKIRYLASLRYTISEIATILLMPADELRLRFANPKDPLACAYKAGKVESQAKYRCRVKKAAEDGESWAISIIEGWERRQLEEELGCHE